MAERINLSTTAETNVDWYADGEPANAAVLNRPIQDVSEVVNAMMDEYESTFSSSVSGASIEVYDSRTGDMQTQSLKGVLIAEAAGMTNGPSGSFTGVFAQFGDNTNDKKIQLAMDSSGIPYARLQWGSGNWLTWGKLVTEASLYSENFLRISELKYTNQSATGTIIPDNLPTKIHDVTQPSFGQQDASTAWSDFNTSVHTGWSYVYGTTNGPSHGGTQGGYRCRIAMGAELGNYGIEMLLPRTATGADGTYLWTRQAHANVWGSWSKISAGNADTVGGLSASQLTASAAHDVHFIAGYSSDGLGEDIRVQTYGTIVLARAMTITGTQGYIGLAPTGSALIVNVLKNGSSVFTTLPQFAVSTNTMTAGVLDATKVSCVAGDVISFTVTQVGSTIRGQQMRFTIKGN